MQQIINDILSPVGWNMLVQEAILEFKRNWREIEKKSVYFWIRTIKEESFEYWQLHSFNPLGDTISFPVISSVLWLASFTNDLI